ncbi:hypothetical protein ACP4OV_025523 [Aristida adscensionis]
MLRDADPDPDLAEGAAEASLERAGGNGGAVPSPPRAGDTDSETAQLCDLLKSKVESLEFLQKIDGIKKSVYQSAAARM